MMPRNFLCASLALAALACSPPPPPAPPASFDRPESLAFFCWDKSAQAVTTIANCTPEEPASGEEDFGRPPEPFEMHAVVAQTGTGEAAVVQLTGDDDNDPPGIVDSDVRLPGFTFAAVGDVPAAVVTPRGDPSFTYVVSRGSSAIHVVDTASFRSGLGALVETYEAGGEHLETESRPAAMVLTPQEDALLIALPELGQIARVAIVGRELAPAEFFDLAVDIPAPVDASALAPGELPPEYAYTCSLDAALRTPPILPPRAAEAPVDARPIPWAFAVDEETGVVLVADRGLPIIHVIDPTTMTELDPIVVSVPTRDLAITPRVPALPAQTERTERFVYAIDETDGSVLAVDYTDPARGSYGAVLAVNIAEPFDRLDVPFPARALEVVTPGYAPAGDLSFCTSPSEAGPGSLHGVFLAVATTEGRVRFFDVFDLDTSCRGVGCATAGSAETEDSIVAIGRHRPRIGEYVDEGVIVTPDPTWESEGAGSSNIEENGAASDPGLYPALVPVTCPDRLGRVFPSSGDSTYICAVTDPWAATGQTITFSYEAPIPGTRTSGANLDESSAFIEVRFDPCALGVLGSEDAPSTGYLAGYPGDLIAITGELPPSVPEELEDECETIVQQTPSGSTTPVLLPLLAAESDPADGRPSYSGRLRVGDPVDELGNPTGVPLAMLRQCFPELLEIEVRSRGSFIVESTALDGFDHPIVRGADARCTVDAARVDAGHLGRAFFDEPYVSPYVIVAFGPRPASVERPILEIPVGRVPAVLFFDPSVSPSSDVPSLLAELRYNTVDERLYVVDQARVGLVRLRLSDLFVQSSFR
jgi:hypothetical protein